MNGIPYNSTFYALYVTNFFWYDMLWYGIWYNMLWYMIWYDIWYDMIWYDIILYDMIWYDMIWYDMIWYDTADSSVCLHFKSEIFSFWFYFLLNKILLVCIWSAFASSKHKNYSTFVILLYVVYMCFAALYIFVSPLYSTVLKIFSTFKYTKV